MRLLIVFCIGLIFATAAGVRADDVSIVTAGKGATALVEIEQNNMRGSGTAFCIDPAGYFLTNSHVVGKAPNPQIKLILNPGEVDQKVTSAHVVRVDTAVDLALIKAENVKSITALEIASSDHVIETQPVMAFGYPFGERLATASGDFPSITVSTGHVTSLRKKAGKLFLIQLDASLNPGNSGGPVLDDKGKVLGVVQAGIPGASLNFAIPAAQVTHFVERPEIALMHSLSQENINKSQDFKIRVTSFDGSAAKLDVDLALTSWDGTNAPGTEAPRHFTAQRGEDGMYTVTTTPVPASTGEKKLLLNARFSTGMISCRTADLELAIGDRKVKLADIRRIDQGPTPSITLATSERIEGAATGLSTVSSEFGELTSVLDLSKALSVDISPADRIPNGLRYTITVKREGRDVGDAQGTLLFNGAMVAGTNTTINPTMTPTVVDSGSSALGNKISIKLPGPVAAVLPAASGRLLLMCIPTLHQILVFDVIRGNILHAIPTPWDNMRVAAGADKLVIAAVDQGMLQRWDLKTFERELAITLPAGGQLDDIALGSASAGPVMLMRRTGPEFIDLTTFNPVAIDLGANSNWWHPHPQYPLSVRASADGKTFAAWEPGLGPSGIRLMVIQGAHATTRYLHETGGVLQPGVDGNLLFTSRGVLSSDLKILNGFNANYNAAPMLCIPTPNAAYYLGVRIASPMEPKMTPTVSLCSSGDRSTLVQLGELPELADQHTVIDPALRQLTIDQRLFYNPDTGAFITLSATADEIFVRHVDLSSTLSKAGVDYLYVTSVPLRTAESGSHYRYIINAKSNRAGLKFKLESAPEGMTLNPFGVIDWDVPKSYPDALASVTVNIKDASGREIYHSFSIKIESN